MELRTVLHIVQQRQFAGGNRTATETATQERHDESWEREFGFGTILGKVLIAVTLQTFDGLVGTTQLQTECFRPTEQVTVLISERGSRTKVASGISTFGLETDGRWLVGLHLNRSIQQRGIGLLLKGNIGIFYST